jgi:toxin-antitoxin system PIN domain toxin
MRALLDVNVIIALLDGGHLMHRAAHRWLKREEKNGWATCPITQNGVLRIMAQPSYPNAQPAAKIASRLQEACRDPSHAFWPDEISLMDMGVIHWNRILGHRQITDAYLFATAIARGGRLVTFDRRINISMIPAAKPEQLCVISE